MDFIKIKHFCCLRFYLFIEHGAGEGQHEREREKISKQTRHWVWSLMQGPIWWPQYHDRSQNQETDAQPSEPLRRPTFLVFKRHLWKGSSQTGRKYLQYLCLTEDLHQAVYRQNFTTLSDNPVFKRVKDLNSHFTNEDRWIDNNHMKKVLKITSPQRSAD